MKRKTSFKDSQKIYKKNNNNNNRSNRNHYEVKRSKSER